MLDEKFYKEFKDFKRIVLKRLDRIEKTLVVMSETLAAHTVAIMNIESTLKIYGDMYDINRESNENLNKRVSSLETRAFA